MTHIKNYWVFYLGAFLYSLVLYAENEASRVASIIPSAVPEHHFLFSLMNPSSTQNNHMLRMDMLSSEYFFVAAHGIGNPSDGIAGLEDSRDGEAKLVTAEKAAVIIREEMKVRGIHPSKPVFIMACNSGAGSEPFSKKVSEILGTRVTGVREWLVVTQWGKTRSGRYRLLAYFFGHDRVRTRTFDDGVEVFL